MLLTLEWDNTTKVSKYQFAFRRGYQAGDVQFILCNLIEKAIEWSYDVLGDLVIIDGDVWKAYDNTTHSTLIKGMEGVGVRRIVSAAWIREYKTMWSVFELQHLRSKPINGTKRFE